jgi:hypothetical protein
MAKPAKDLSAENAALKKALHARDQHIAVLEEKLRLALHKRFAASSEKTLPGQFNLFNEAEALSAGAVAEEATTTIPEHKRKKARTQAVTRSYSAHAYRARSSRT